LLRHLVLPANIAIHEFGVIVLVGRLPLFLGIQMQELPLGRLMHAAVHVDAFPML